MTLTRRHGTSGVEPPDTLGGTRGADLARSHRTGPGRARPLAVLAQLPAIGRYFEALRPLLLSEEGSSSANLAAEWFLDNDYLLQRAIRQVQEDLPPGFFERLPALEDGRPRIHDLARGLLAATEPFTDRRSITSFVASYQEVAPLRMCELWALPTMLRLEALRGALLCLIEAFPEGRCTIELERRPEQAEPTETGEALGQCFRLLREVSAIPWQEFFREVSGVEAILGRDPAGAYRAMERATADAYRKTVEEIAWSTGATEAEVAERAVERARNPDDEHPRSRHIGHYLFGSGKHAFEHFFGYRPPRMERLRRALTRHPARTYLTLVGAFTLGVWLIALLAIAGLVLSWAWLLGAALALVPASVLGVELTNWLLTRVLPPRILPKMDYTAGIPENCKTIVVVPSLLSSRREARDLVQRIEKHYLANPDPQLEFAILADFVDAPQKEMPDDEALTAVATGGVTLLNERYGGGERYPFHLFLRERLWNPQEERWMGWERKRGKLEEFNRLLAGERDTSYALHCGSDENLQRFRYAITLDSDTGLPHGSAARLVAAQSHPLNRALFDEHSGRVVEGYTVIQPRVEIAPTALSRTRFSRIYAGDTRIDIYSSAVSDAYQDLSGAGSYVGKGTYDVSSFRRSLEQRVPENRLLSHDLFEGIHGHAALATDIVLYEDYPSHYVPWARRLHRWIRGDWQLLAWLGRRVPLADGTRAPNRLRLLDRWKIFDNLRRSLVGPVLLALLLAGWTVLPGGPWAWTAFVLLITGGGLLVDLARALSQRLRSLGAEPTSSRHGRGLAERAGRWLTQLAFLPHESGVALDAIVRTLFRLHVSSRRLLEWSTAAAADQIFTRRLTRAFFWTSMPIGPLLALALVPLLWQLRPEALVWAWPLLVLWLASPELARFLSRPLSTEPRPISAEQRRELRKIARRTWLFFETFVGPEDQWLPPDNYQEHPLGVVAHRTSPTNIGMMLVSTLSAHELGFLSLTDLVLRLVESLQTFDRLERYRGHFLNWYDTRDLRPLEPRYVSTVDSGNLAGDLLVVRQACAEAAGAQVLSPIFLEGLRDLLLLLEDTVERIGAEAAQAEPWRAVQVRIAVALGRLQPQEPDALEWLRLLRTLEEEDCPEIDRLSVEAVRASAGFRDVAALRELRTWCEKLHALVGSLLRDVESTAPWVQALLEPPALLLEAPEAGELARTWQVLAGELATRPRLVDAPRLCARAQEALDELDELARATGRAIEPYLAWSEGLREFLDHGEIETRVLRDELLGIGVRAEAEAEGMDFGLLYDEERHLFRIGFNISADRPDANHYDLLASEARLASFLAVAKGDVPLEHWFTLGRPVTRLHGRSALLSWGATAFEYLMPALLMRSDPESLLAVSCRTAVEAQIRHGASKRVPWGISEAGYYHFDPDQNYQYRAFGVPGLGFKRGLGDDLVVAPYASLMALSIRPRAVMENIAALRQLGAMGLHGFYEALDFTPRRLPRGKRMALVQSHMAHHQGMSLAAIANYLGDGSLIRHFHSNPLVQTTEVLLHEQIPAGLPQEKPQVESEAPRTPRAPGLVLPPTWLVPSDGWPEAQALSNGSLTSVITGSGSGGLLWHDLALTRWTADPVRDREGVWLYVFDSESGELWSAGSSPTHAAPREARVEMSAHLVSFTRRDLGVFLGVDIWVDPGADVEIRRAVLVNETDRPRSLSLVSYGEVALSPPAAAARHPAFDKLFVISEYAAEEGVLAFRRRPRSQGEPSPVLLHRIVAEREEVFPGGYETSRERFLGRTGSPRRPRLLATTQPWEPGTSGSVLDPIFSLRADVELAPQQRVELAFLTVVGATLQQAQKTSARFPSLEAVGASLRNATNEAAREMRKTRLGPGDLRPAQRTLSALLYPRPGLGLGPAAAESIALARPRLWGFGISGDFPVLLLKLHDLQESELLEEALRVHHLYRGRRIPFALVVLREGVSGYDDDVMGPLQRVIEASGSQAWMNRRGGIFVVRNDQVPPEERRVLEACARVVLDSKWGRLAEQVEAAQEPDLELPLFQPSAPPDIAETDLPELERETDLVFANPWGGFTPDGSEYVIHLEAGAPTPAPWCNVLANPHFGCMLSESALGYTWSGNAGERRLSPWSNDPVRNEPAEAVYLRDEETAEVWSTTPLPAGAPAPYQVRHGSGYSVYRHHSHGLEQRMRVFVAPDDPVKYLCLELRNATGRARRITATYFVDWTLGTTRSETLGRVVPSYSLEHGTLLARCDWNPDFAGRVAFVTSDRQPHGYTTDRREFLGGEAFDPVPAALRRLGLSSTVATDRDCCAALMVHLDLAPGAVVAAHFALGEAADLEAALALAARVRTPERAQEAFIALRASWEELLGCVQVQTPVASFDLMINRWLPLEFLAGRIWGRTGFYQSSGAFGFRDQLQDTLALALSKPEVARAHLLEAARHQFEEGDVLHWWHPPRGNGVRTRCSDDLLWLVYATAHYVEATGDDSILREQVPFLSAPPLAEDEADRYSIFETSQERAELMEHCRRSLERASRRGPQGLPPIGDGDWNDGMNRIGEKGRGESVWMGWFLGACYQAFARLCERDARSDEAATWREEARLLAETVEEVAWDGAWYRRASYADGAPIGSSQSDECRIDSIAQSWSVISGLGDPERAARALASATEHLVLPDERLVLLLAPPFDSGPRDPGYIKGYPPGIRENGGQYTHASAWLGWARALSGDGEGALEIFELLNPIPRTLTDEDCRRYCVEPYVIPADVYSTDPHVGRGGWTWYTGAAAWVWRLGLEAILGLRPVEGDLELNPRIPKAWGGFRMDLTRGLCHLHIEITDPQSHGCGVDGYTLDGRPHPGRRIPVSTLNGAHTIEVVLVGA